MTRKRGRSKPPPRKAKRGSFPIVGIGASAGGLEAFSDLLKHLPIDTGMAFVLVQHLDPLHESALTQILSRITAMPVLEVTDNRRVEPNHVYIIPPSASLAISRGSLKLAPRKASRTPHHSIDMFLESLAREQRERSIGVILSGTATDGTLGLEAIKAEGGITFAQDESARYDSMPRSAIAMGCVDFVLPPQLIARELARIAKHPYLQESASETQPASAPAIAMGRTAKLATKIGDREADGGEEHSFRKVLMVLRNHSGVDFSLYKSTTIRRRVARRVLLNKKTTLENYTNFLRGNVKELDALYSDLLISVTGFFRNPDAFDALASRVLPKLNQQRGDDPIRAWVLGCSTGQEAYSIAMLLTEAADKLARPRKLQVFATDLNQALLKKAREGFYPQGLMQDVSPQRRKKFFVEEQGGYRVIKSLRETVVFAQQNLIDDPPFSRMDLISCRNLLIYLEPALQQRVMPMFHYALKPGGFLLLGASESIGSFSNLFESFDKKQKIYAKKAAPTTAYLFPTRGAVRTRPTRSAEAGSKDQVPVRQPEPMPTELTAQREADRVTVQQFAPPAVLIDAELQILQFRGPTGAYLEPPTGRATFDLLKMAREGLMLPLRAVINKAKRQGKTARSHGIRVQRNGRDHLVEVEVIPLKNLRDRCFLVVFEEAGPTARADASASADRKNKASRGRDRAGPVAKSRTTAELEGALRDTRDYLQSLQEQHEAANEELQASNEEVQSANEELQSLNEELETSKEELESANEELTTVNEEMSSRNVELVRLNGDLNNLQTSSRLAIILLNRDLTVRRFSPQAAKLFDLQSTDIGRPIGHVRHHLDIANDFEDFIERVITDMSERERETRDEQGRWYSLRVHPYFTLENRVDGAVVVLIDIDSLKHTEEAVGAARDYANYIIHMTREPLLVLDADLRVNRANEAFYTSFGIAPAQSSGQLVYELDDGQWDIPQLHEVLEQILARDGVCENFEIRHTFRKLGPRTLLVNARRLRDVRGKLREVLLGIQDVTQAV